MSEVPEWLINILENETWGKLWPILVAASIGAYLKFKLDEYKLLRGKDETLARWIRTTLGLRRAVSLQRTKLKEYISILASGVDRGTQLEVVITIRCTQFDRFDSADLYAPLRKRVFNRWLTTRAYSVDQADRYATNAEVNIQYGKELYGDLVRYQNRYSDARARVTRSIGDKFTKFRRILGMMQFPEMYPTDDPEVIRRGVWFYESRIKSIVEGEDVLALLCDIVRDFYEIYWDKQHDKAVQQLWALGNGMSLDLRELDFHRGQMAKDLSGLEKRYKSYDVDLSRWLVGVNW